MVFIPGTRCGDERRDQHQDTGGDRRMPDPRTARRGTDIMRERSDKAVALPGHRFDEPRHPGIVAKGEAHLPEAVVQAAIEVDMSLVSPDCLPQIVPSD